MNDGSKVLVILSVVSPQSQGLTSCIKYSATVGVPAFSTITSKKGVGPVESGGVDAGCSTTGSVSQARMAHEM